MKVVIFAGGLGTRIAEESHLKPKPMIEIGGRPILWHIMKIYEAQGFNDFVICLGYKHHLVKEYFINYFMHNSDIRIDMKTNRIEVLETAAESFKITLVDTGLHTRTAGRLKRVLPYLDNEDFMLTYGDGVADIDLHALLEFHKKHNRIVTVTAVQPVGKFGAIVMDEAGQVEVFKEKPAGDGFWINGGFFVVKPDIVKYLPENSDQLMWEDYPLEQLTHDKELVAYRHRGFWKCMDALRDKHELEELWVSGHAQWKIWQ